MGTPRGVGLAAVSLWWSRPRRGVTVAVALGTAALILVSALAFADTAVTYAMVRHCDDDRTTLRPDWPGVPLDEAASDQPIIQVVGNSLVTSITPCFESLVNDRGFALETVSGPGRASCNFIPLLRKQVANPATRPDVAVWFSFDWFVGRPGNALHACNDDWKEAPQEALRIWAEAGVHVYLVPPPPLVTQSSDSEVLRFPTGDGGTKDAPAQVDWFRVWAARDPLWITVIDAGLFLRDADGVFQSRMPCASSDEPGCADGTIAVRWTDGFHFCADPAYTGLECAPRFSGGDRRVAAAIAYQIDELRGT